MSQLRELKGSKTCLEEVKSHVITYSVITVIVIIGAIISQLRPEITKLKGKA